MAHVLFSAEPEDIGLYGKPMARNAQIWTHRYESAARRAAGRPRGVGEGGGRLA